MKKVRSVKKTAASNKPPVDAALVQGLSELVTSNTVVAGRSDVIPLHSIVPNPDNPRKRGVLTSRVIGELREKQRDPASLNPDEALFFEKLTELAQSIDDSDIGLIQPIVVYEQGGQFILHAGERRFLAHHYLGRDQIQAIIRPFENNPQSSEGRFRDMSIALIENIQRDNLTFQELIQAVVTLNTHFKDINGKDMRPKDLMQVIHQSKGQCSKLITIITGDQAVLDLIAQGEVTSQKQAYDLNKTPSPTPKSSESKSDKESNSPAPMFTEEDGPQSPEGINIPGKSSARKDYVSLGNTQNRQLVKKIASLLLDPDRLIGIDWNDFEALQLIWDEAVSHFEQTM